ncbi:phosphopantetheine-binding protein [Sinomonas sp. JGH33]|uniref:Phosphopantetheine-binding protein n=1 Tax=Sinomonas terricola TaxID=3110330 RepID=A0ABU5TAV9_9MICC|nr:phosphopantetheine-binding protein [Sinomonas sp. JGH33]MEA5456827.1 phosphopantetheine-binding protein [Sinomonas sp. JGH33]
MTEWDARAAVIEALGQIAPELEPGDLEDGARLRQDLDLDSLDFLRLIEQIAGTTGVDVPERDYPRVTTVGELVRYLDARRTAT